jgi:hypothetical protein
LTSSRIFEFRNDFILIERRRKMESNFEFISANLARVGISFSQEDYVEWAFMKFDRDTLTDIIVKSLPCRYVLPQYSTRVFDDWKKVTNACFRLSKSLDVKYPQEFFRKISFRGRVTKEVYTSVVQDFAPVMKSVFSNKISEMVADLPDLSLVRLSINLPLSKLSEMEERFQSSTTETDFESFLERLIGRETIISKFAPVFQLGLPQKVWEVLETMADVECFASPLDVHLSDYCSVFDEDKHFGSFGNFFDLELQKKKYMIHVPFSSLIANAIKSKIKGSEATFYIFVPFDIETKVGFGELTKMTKTLAPSSYCLSNGVTHYSYVVAVINGSKSDLDSLVKSLLVL